MPLSSTWLCIIPGPAFSAPEIDVQYHGMDQNDIMATMSSTSKTTDPSGRFLLRIDPGLHAVLRQAAAEGGMSLNSYCATKLAAPLSSAAMAPEIARAVTRAASLFAEDLVGVVLFGSWARGEADEGSDIDLLVVVEADVELTRSLYREWDREPVTWEEHPVEPHFVHLPGPDHDPVGTWAEVAVDGLVLFERGLELSSRLREIRREIAEGKLVRKTIHGQPYWAEVA